MKFEETKIAENDKFNIYTSEFTSDFKDGYRTVIAEDKETGMKEYLLLCKGKPVYASKNLENVLCRHDIMVMADQ